MTPPSGYVTFIFTDVEGSTKLAQEFPEQLSTSIELHNSILSKAVGSNNGFVFEIIGDAFCCAFEKAEDAVRAAVEIQLNLAKEKWEDTEIKIRIGIHSGNAEWIEGKYLGYITLARSSRVMSCGYGGQIIVSNSSYELVKDKFNAKEENRISFIDLGERRMKDVIQPIKLYQVECNGLRADFPPLRTLDARPNNLPVQLTSFIGREKEISAIKEIMNKVRLLTLIGPGGTGKTRLSMQVAADLIDQFANGVWIVELASLQDPEIVPQTIAVSLGVKEQTGQDSEHTLINYLKEKEILIILDNCEHLINSCASISENLLQNCPKLKIITTSREALNSFGEHRYNVLSLAYPKPKDLNTVQELSQFEAVRLFIERAVSVNSDFRVNNENAPALAQICYQLDGIPFAIELAAARIRILPVEKICEKLDDRFKLLTGGKRTALPRQQTLKAMIDWSYDLLTDKEKLLMQRLSVFSGGWTLEAAEEVCSDEKIDMYETMDLNTNLLDKSLISGFESLGSIRFHMLESIKEYAKGKLEDVSEFDQKHFDYFKKLADHQLINLKKIKQLDWVKLLESDLDNIRSSINWAMDNDPDKSFELVNEMGDFWNIKGFFIEALQTCQKVLKTELQVTELNKAQVLYLAALMSTNLGDSSQAEEYIKESLSIFRKIDNKESIAKCLNVYGVAISYNPARASESMEYYQEAISIFRNLNIKKDTGTTLFNMSFVVNKKEHPEKFMEYKLEALKIFQELNETHEIALSLVNLGVVEYRNNNFEKSKSYSEESLALSYQIGDNYLISANLINLGCVFLGLGKYQKASELIEEAIKITRECGYRSSYLAALMYLGEVKVKLTEYEKAVELFEESVRTGTETGNEYYLGNNYYNLGTCYYDMKDYKNSLKYFLLLKKDYHKFSNVFDKEKMKISEEYISKMEKMNCE